MTGGAANDRPQRPPAVVAAVLLMVPAGLTWFAAAIGWLLVTWRLEGDFLFLFWILAVLIVALCLLVTGMTISGIRHAWRGWSGLLAIPAGFTVALFVLTLVTLIGRGRISYHPTMLTPLIVGGLAAVALVLLRTGPARKWFAGGLARRAVDLRERRSAARPAEGPPR